MSRRARGRTRNNPWGTLVTGAALLAAGVIFWLDRMGRFDARDALQWWPLVLIGWGVASLPERRYVGAAVMVVLGVLFLPAIPGLPHLHLVHLLALWPLLIAVAGVTLVVQALRPTAKDAPREKAFHAVAVMAGNNRRIAADRFAGGEAVAVMGGCDIDLTASTPLSSAEGEAVIDVLAFWGGIDITVPRGWEIENRVLPVLGAVSDMTSGGGAPNAPRLVLRGSVIMGAVEVRNPKEIG